jgi:hypothetical protein
MYQAQLPFEEVAAEFDIRNEQERAVLRQKYAATRAMYARWQQDLLAAVPTARIVELPGANLFMFLSNEADVPRDKARPIRLAAISHRERRLMQVGLISLRRNPSSNKCLSPYELADSFPN